MKKIGLILKGQTAQNFLNKLLSQYHSSNFYTIITPDKKLIPQTHPDSFVFHHFDPTSAYKLKKTLSSHLDAIFLIHKSHQDTEVIYKILHDAFPKIPIILHSKRPISQNPLQDPLLEEVSISSVVANKLLSYLPDIPTPIQDIGLGKGEIMEIPVPSGSVYCYRTLGSISQKEWRIAGIYRNEELLLSSYSLSIRPNDRLLAIGNPKILGNIYRQITNALGQFPIPFGKDLFLYLDEDLLSENEILHDLNEALFLHKHLNSSQLIITILNPKRFELLEHIKSIQDKEINVYLNYIPQTLPQIFNAHHQKRIGLAILNHKLFQTPEVKKTLFELSIPVFKTAQISIQKCSNSLVLLENDKDIASVTFDIASQLDLKIEIYDFEVDGQYHHECFENYKNLSKIFAKPIRHTQSNTKNPIIYALEIQKPTLQFIPFDFSVANTTLLNVTSTKLSYHSAQLSRHPQILIPISSDETHPA